MKTHDGLTSLALACAFLFGATTSAAAANSPSSSPQDKSATPVQAVDDAWITTKVKAGLATADGVAATDVSVTTANGVVTLTGVVPNQAAIDKAIATARAIKGVSKVDSSGLKAGTAAPVKADSDAQAQSSGPAQAVDDAWISTKIKAELATTAGVPVTDVKVDTANGVVTLTGVMDSEITVKKAIAAARSVKGVKQVDASGLKSR